MAQFTKNLFQLSLAQRSTHNIACLSRQTISSCCVMAKPNSSTILTNNNNNNKKKNEIGTQCSNNIHFCQKRHKFSFQDAADDDNLNFSSKSQSSRFGGNFSSGFSPDSSRMMRNNGFEKGKFEKQHIVWSEEDLTPFRKDFYREHPSVTAMTESEVKQMREDSHMIVFGKDIPKPFKTFKESGIPSQCLTHLDKMGISQPSAIQQQGIPMALSGRDIVGISRTGSGKTLAYLLPAIVHIQAQPVVQRGEGPIGLVLAPTRELTLQISEEISKYCETNSDIQLKHCAVFGGADRHKQIRCLRQSPDLLVATPGRLLDLLQCGETNFKRCTYLVLDEADRMLDMGFRDDLETILSYVRPDRQVLMWSATWPKEIQEIAKNYMKDPIRVQIGSTDLHANHDIHQNFRHIGNPRMKLNAFLKDVEEVVETGKKCLVFSNTKAGADMIEETLSNNNVRAKAIHGGKTQTARENILSNYRNNKIQVLIATDVVARGIDIRDIEVVIVYDMPGNLEDYVHRIGRTARAGDKGVSLAYVTNDDISRVGSKLVTLLNKSKQQVPKWLQSASRF